MEEKQAFKGETVKDDDVDLFYMGILVGFILVLFLLAITNNLKCLP